MAIYDANKWIQSILLNDPDMTADSETDIVSQHSVVAYVANQLTEWAGLNETQVQALIDQAISTLSSTDITDFNTAVNAVITAFGAVTQAELTAQLNQNTIDSTAYTDQEIHDLYINSDLGYPQWQQDIWIAENIPITSMKEGELAKPAFEKFTDDGAGSVGVYTYTFENNKTQDLSVSWSLSPRWRPGTDVYPAVRWMPITAGGVDERVHWGLEYHVRGFTETLSNSTVVQATLSQPDEDYIAEKLYTSIFPPVDMSAYTSGFPELAARLFRGTDTYSDDIMLMCFGFLYKVSRPGCLVTEFPDLTPGA